MEPPTYYWMDEKTRSNPDVVQMIAAIDAVTAELHLQLHDKHEPTDLSGAMAVLAALKDQIHAGLISDSTLKGSADGVFAQGVHKLSRSTLIADDTPSEVLGELVGWIEFASTSPYPEVRADTEASFEQFSSWGSPSARLEAAETCLDLTLKRPEVYTRLKPLIDRMLVDPHPAVRMNAALSLIRIRDLDRQGFWDRASQIVCTEENRAVLDAFIARTLSTLVWHGAARQTADLVLPLLDRLPADDPRNGPIRTHLVQMTLQFWIRFNFPDAAERVDGWVAESVDNAKDVRDAILWFRNAYTAGLRGAEDPEPGNTARGRLRYSPPRWNRQKRISPAMAISMA